MADYEKLGVFYLGKKYDLAAKKPAEDLVLYPSKNLVTHAVVLGMTGSGKTGLCVGLIEEAAIDNIPAILIDPKRRSVQSAVDLPAIERGSVPTLDQ
jgi:hypothetical protein